MRKKLQTIIWTDIENSKILQIVLLKFSDQIITSLTNLAFDSPLNRLSTDFFDIRDNVLAPEITEKAKSIYKILEKCNELS